MQHTVLRTLLVTAADCAADGSMDGSQCSLRRMPLKRHNWRLRFHLTFDPFLPLSCRACVYVFLQWRRAHPAKASLAALVRDVAALTLSGSYFYYVWGLGPLPQELQQHAWVLQQHRPLQQGVALVLLVAVFLAVFVLTPRR